MTDEKHPFLIKTDDSVFKDKRNQWLTRALFFEYSHPGITPIFTMKDDDYKGYKSLKKIYLAYDHIPEFEYEFANEVLGGWEHWERLQASPDINRHIESWKKEKDIQLRAEAIRNVIRTARSADKASLQAARYLADKGYLEKADGRGRPSKSEREARLKEDKAVIKEVDEDLKRLGLIHGGKS